MSSSSDDITALLVQLRDGDHSARSRLAEAVYQELHSMAKRYMRYERRDHTLQPTVLVHETYQQLVGGRNENWQDRTHFYAAAAQSMRRILVDYARSRRAVKRGGDRTKIDLTDAITFTIPRGEELLALDEALYRLADLDSRQSQIVELKFFGGLTDEEIAKMMDVSSRTVKREWATAKGWLHSQLASPAAE